MAPSVSKFASGARRRSPLISRNAPTSTSTQNGRLTNSTQRQPGPSERTPPRKTPRADARPAIAPQAPSALRRSVPSLKVVVSVDRAAGSIIAAPSPCTRRAATSMPSLPARPPVSEASANTDVPATRTRRRPKPDRRPRGVGRWRFCRYQQAVGKTTLVDSAKVDDGPVANGYYYVATNDDLERAVLDAHPLDTESYHASLARHRTPKARLKA